MKSPYLGMIALVSAVLMAACVSASEGVATKERSTPVKQDMPVVNVYEVSNPVLVAEADVQELDEDGFPLPKQKKKLGKAPPPPADAMTPLERVKSAPLGTLKNPYKHELNDMAVWGKQRFMGNSCNGCHGGTGGGGMCPPLSNATWVYGKDDDTLFRLIVLGSDEYQKQYGKTRQGRENVVGPMPGFGHIVKTDDEVWRMISFIRTIYNDDPKDDPRNVH
jgi:mono/diheme cytochrome c family protein